jgi:hypothetical protein
MLADEQGIQIIFPAIGANKARNLSWIGFQNLQGLKSWSNGLFSFTMRRGEAYPVLWQHLSTIKQCKGAHKSALRSWGRVDCLE